MQALVERYGKEGNEINGEFAWNEQKRRQFAEALQNGDKPEQQVGLHVRLVQPGVLSLGQRVGEEITPISQHVSVTRWSVALR